MADIIRGTRVKIERNMRVSIPKEFRQHLNIEPGDLAEFDYSELNNNRIVIRVIKPD